MLRKFILVLFAVALMGAYASATSPSESSSYSATYWTFDFGESVKIAIPGSTFAPTFTDGPSSDSYSWHNVSFAGATLNGSYTYNGSYYSVYWNGVSKTFSYQKDAKEYLDRQFINLIAGMGGVASATGAASPVGGLHLAANEAIATVITPKLNSRQYWKSHGKAKQKHVNLIGDTNRKIQALAQVQGANPTAWNDSATSSLRYERRWWNQSEANMDKVGATLRGGFSWDKVTIDVLVPLDRADFNGDYDFLDFTRAGVIVIPRLYLATQEEHPIDLSVGFTGFYFHTFMDKGDVNPNHGGGGPFVAVQKDFENFVLGAGFIWQRGFNMDGDTEISGDTETDIVKLSMNVGVPIGDRWAVNGSIAYSHTYDLPQPMDKNFVTVGLSANYMLKDAWSVDFGLNKDFSYNDANNIEANLGVAYSF